MINKNLTALAFALSFSVIGTTFSSDLEQDKVEYSELKKQIRENQAISIDSICYGTISGLLGGTIGAGFQGAITKNKSFGTGAILGFLSGAMLGNLAQEEKLNKPLAQKKNELKKEKLKQSSLQ